MYRAHQGYGVQHGYGVHYSMGSIMAKKCNMRRTSPKGVSTKKFLKEAEKKKFICRPVSSTLAKKVDRHAGEND